MSAPQQHEPFCSFCGKARHEVNKLVAGANGIICDECVVVCMTIYLREDAALFEDIIVKAKAAASKS